MSTLATAGALLLWGWGSAVAATSTVAIGRAVARRRRARDAQPQATPRPAVVVVRPCAGLEASLEEALRSTARLRYRGALRIVLSTSRLDDPARPVVRSAARWLRARGLRVQVEVVPPRGANHKASQLAGIVDGAREEVALVIDSDVMLDELDLDAMLEPICDPQRCDAAVWCAPVERVPRTVGDHASAAVLGGSLHAFPLLGALDPAGMVGKTFAIRLDALREVGGFAGHVTHLGEDMELARRLAARGWTVSQAAPVVASMASGRSVREVIGRYARWLMVIRAQRPALLGSYPLLLAATPLLLLACALGLVAGLPGMGATMLAIAGLRLLVAIAARALTQRSLRPAGVVLDAVLGDLLLLIAFGRAAFGPRRVRWRGRMLTLGPGGRLAAPEEPTTLRRRATPRPGPDQRAA